MLPTKSAPSRCQICVDRLTGMPMVDDLCKAATRNIQSQPGAAAPASTGELRTQAEAIMTAVRDARLSGRALEEALRTYQNLWDRIELIEEQGAKGSNDSAASTMPWKRPTGDFPNWASTERPG